MATGQLTENVRREVLDNGLTVLVREDRSAPVAAVVTWLKSGYFDEDDDQVGLAHVCEHMYFNGTSRRPGPEDIAREVKSLGGELNAGTYYHFTAYHVVLPAERFGRALDVQADAFSDPLMDEAVLEKEMGAIIQEAKRKLDNPAAVARERMYAEAFDEHRIRRWRIGTEEQLRGYGPEDLRRFWDAHYVPGNAIVSIAGAVDPERALAAMRESFGGLAAREPRRSRGPAEPERAPALRHGRSPMDVGETTAVLGLRTVPDGHPDALPLQLLARVLAGGRSSRLVRELRERRRLVSGVSAGAHSAGELGLFDLMLRARPERTEEALEALFEQLGRCWREPPSEQEMERARNALRASHLFGGASMFAQAQALAECESRGGYELLDRELGELLAVEPEDVLRVARTWLAPERVTIHEVLPEEGAPPAPEPAALQERLARAAGERPEPGPTVGARAPVVLPPLAGDAAGEGWSEQELENGLRLVHRRDSSRPTLALLVGLSGGRRGDLEGRAGWTRLGAALLPRGTRRRGAEELAEAVEALGASLSSHVSDDLWGLAVGLVSEHARTGAGLFFEALLEPAFAEAELEKARDLQLQAVKRLEDQPLALALELGRQAAFGEQLPGLSSLGDEDGLGAASSEALAAWHEGELEPGNLRLVLVGDLPLDEARELVTAALAGRALAGRPAARELGAAAFREGARREVERRKQQTAQAILFPGVPADHEDAAALELLAACSSSLGGRFFEEVRSKRGLAYVVAAAASQGRSCGWFTAFLATSPSDEERAREVLLDEARRLAAEPPAGEELARAQEYLCGRHALALQGHAAQASAVLSWLDRGLGLEELERRPGRLRAVTSEQLAEAARRYLDPDRAALGLVRGGA